MINDHCGMPENRAENEIIYIQTHTYIYDYQCIAFQVARRGRSHIFKFGLITGDILTQRQSVVQLYGVKRGADKYFDMASTPRHCRCGPHLMLGLGFSVMCGRHLRSGSGGVGACVIQYPNFKYQNKSHQICGV